jgi:hypothetical protein
VSASHRLPTLRQAALQVYRLAVLVAIAWVIRAHHILLRIEGDAPISLAELTPLYPGAAELRPDPGERRGLWVHDAKGKMLGYVVRTLPDAALVVGYRGWTDTLVAFDPALHVLGVRLRDSQDTKEHVGDVRDDRYYLKTWNGKSWDEVAGKTPEQFGIEGVSGATMTSMAMAEGIMRRLANTNAALAIKPPPVRLTWRDGGLIAIILAGIVLSFTGTHGRRWLRRGFQILVIVYVGFLSGDLLAQSLIAGWTAGGVPWRSAPGLVLMLAAALAVPWTTGKPLYCQHLCPHGAAQELLHGLAPKRWRLHLRKDVAAGLRWLPPGLLIVVLVTTMWLLPFDLAHLEPFDAYLIKSAGIATITIAVAGLAASLFVPMAYCHYGCPTGALLNFIRAHGPADRFGRRDATALCLLALAVTLACNYQHFHGWVVTIR